MERASKPVATIVTGGSTGIGAATCEMLLDAGQTVLNISRHPGKQRHNRLHFYATDLTDEKATAASLEEITAHFDVTRLVNNAGVIRPALLQDATLADLEHVFQLHLRAAMQLTQGVLPAMQAHHFGRIVSIASRATLGKAMRTVYSATKAGLIGFTRTWALELGRSGITVNAINPGPIATELFLKGNPPDSPQTQKLIENIAVGRMGEPKDIARVVSFLLHEDSSFITGQTLNVCGGASIGGSPW